MNFQGFIDKSDLPEIPNLIFSYDIFGVNVMWLRDAEDIFITGYSYYPLNRKGSSWFPRGGSSLIKNDMRDFI